MTLDSVFSALKKATENELALWLDIWPPLNSSIVDLIKARQTTAQAALNYMSKAYSDGVAICDNARVLSMDSSVSNSESAVNDILSQIKQGDMTKEKLRASLALEEPYIPNEPIATRVLNTKIATKGTLLSSDNIIAKNPRIGLDEPEVVLTPVGSGAVANAVSAADSKTAQQKDSSGSDPNIGDVYSDISGILANIGEGLANAQLQLDMGALRMQKEILNDSELSGYGLTATWYVMPEVEFDLKMEIEMSYEKTEEGTINQMRPVKLLARVPDTKYNSLYKTSSTQETSLRVKFVPVPMPAVVRIPKVTGSTVAAARRILSGAAVNSSFIDKNGNDWGVKDGVVTAQSVSEGEVMMADKVLVLTAEEM